MPADASVARSGATARDGDWRDELLRTEHPQQVGSTHPEFTRVKPVPAP